MSTDGVKRKLAAILSADVKGYGSLMARDEVATIRTLKEYKEIMTGLITQHHGRVVDAPGDNLLAEFPSVVDAVQGAVAIQKELWVRNESLPEDRRMWLRIGLNLGDVIEEGDRIYGDGVNIAARLESLADPGGICLSRTAYDQIEDKLPLGYQYLGEKNLKNMTRPIRAYKVILDQVAGLEDEDETVEAPVPPVRGRRKRLKDMTSEERAARRARMRAWSKMNFYRHRNLYFLVMGFLLAINLWTWSGVFWVIWPAMGWGLAVFSHWLKVADRFQVKND